MRLDAKDVNISISGKPIVQHLSIEVPDRKFSALLGANGSGKTTLLRSIYRTQKMDSTTPICDLPSPPLPLMTIMR